MPDELRGGAVTIGNFDGVHRGHARLVKRLIDLAAEVGGPAIVFTFDPHPVRLLRPEQAPPPLTWTDRKADLLAELGVAAMVAYPTDERLLELSAEQFFRELLIEQLGARAIVEGPNFYFGKNRSGDIHSLARLCENAGIRLEIVEPEVNGDDYISSSRIRNAIRDGDVASAAEMLVRPYRIRGMVTHGAGRGAKIGFATANIAAIDTLIPAPGVYAGVGYADSKPWPAAINVGPKPTFGDDTLSVEAHLIDYSGSLYGQPLEVDFLTRLRDIQPFESVAALTAQLARDVEAARRTARTDEES